MSHVIYRGGATSLPMVAAGEGCYLIDDQGKRYLDGSSGPVVSCLGHSHPDVIRAIQAQVARLAFAHTSYFTNEPMERLADLIVDGAPAGLSKVVFVCGGSEAIESAVMFARQYQVAIGQPARVNFISRHRSYHGATMGALGLTGSDWRRHPYEELTLRAHRIGACFEYRGRRADETAEEYGQRVAGELEHKILELGPDTVAAFVAETVVGAALGAVPAVPGYFARIREICDRYGVLLILDEVMCGMGRTGTKYACVQEGVRPDIVAFAKGIGAGYQPLGATVCSTEIDAAILQNGGIQQGHTYSGHATACAAGVAVQEVVKRENLYARVRQRGQELEQALRARLGDHPHVGDIRGRGLFWGVDLVAERDTKKPFPPDIRLHAKVKAKAFERGLLCYPMSGSADGTAGDHVLVSPPFIVSSAQIDELTEKLGLAIDDALQERSMRRWY